MNLLELKITGRETPSGEMYYRAFLAFPQHDNVDCRAIGADSIPVLWQQIETEFKNRLF